MGPSVRLSGLQEATVIARPNRFVAEVRLRDSGDVVTAHVADSGRLRELIFPGNTVMVRRAVSGTAVRRTPFDMVLASTVASPGASTVPSTIASHDAGRRIWVSVDTRYPNTLFGMALRSGALKEFGRCDVSAEYWYHNLSPWKEEAERGRDLARQAKEQEEPQQETRSQRAQVYHAKEKRRSAARPIRSRMDFYLAGSGSTAERGGPDCPSCAGGPDCYSRAASCLIEVKSVTLCRNGVGYFPDAPTDRGARHLHELTRASREGYSAYAVFIAQREDIETISPNRDTDPAFADALREAKDAGVRLLGYRCTVSPTAIRLITSTIPVVLA